MAKLTVTFHPLFILFVFVMVFFGWIEVFAIYMLALIIHEMAHYFTAKQLGYKLNKIIFMPYGAALTGKATVFKPSHEIFIALAGPAVNFFLLLVMAALWWVFPVTYAYTELFAMANLSLGLFNLLPVFPLDGGRVLLAALANKPYKAKVIKSMNITAVIFSLLFMALFLLSVFYKLNFSFAFISLFLLSSVFGHEPQAYYERSFLNTNPEKAMEVKTYLIKKDTPLVKLIKYMRGNYFVQFLVLDDNGKAIKLINETEVKKLLDKKF